MLYSVRENLTLWASTGVNGAWSDLACILRCCCYAASRPIVCPFRGTNRRQRPSSCSEMQASSPRWAHTSLMLRHAAGVELFRTLLTKAFWVWRHHSGLQNEIFLLKLESSQSPHTSAKAMLVARWQHHLRFCSGFLYAPLKAMVTKISKWFRI